MDTYLVAQARAQLTLTPSGLSTKRRAAQKDAISCQSRPGGYAWAPSEQYVLASPRKNASSAIQRGPLEEKQGLRRHVFTRSPSLRSDERS